MTGVFDNAFPPSGGSVSMAAIERVVAKYQGIREWAVTGEAAFKSPIASDNGMSTWGGLLGPISGEYYMTYTAIDGSGKTCIRIESLGTDLDNLTPSGSPVTIISGDQAYDTAGVFLSSAFEIEGSTVHGFYCGTPSSNANHQICRVSCPTNAVMTPGSWTKHGVAIAHDSALLPAGLFGGVEPTGLMRWNGFYWLYGCSVPGSQRGTPASGYNINLMDRRGFVAKSSSISDWSGAEVRMLMAEETGESRVQPWRYLISAHPFRQGSASTSLFYLLASVDSVNTDYQRGVIFSCHDPWFAKEYAKVENTFLLVKDEGGTFPNGEIDVFSVLTTDIDKDTYTSSKFKVLFGGRNLNSTWSCGLLEKPTIHEALRPGIIPMATKALDVLPVRAGSLLEREVNSSLMLSTTIASVTSQTVIVLTKGSSDNDAYNDCVVTITDGATALQKARVTVSDYVGSSKTLTIGATPVFTISVGDIVNIIASGSTASGGGGGLTVDQQAQLDAIEAKTNLLTNTTRPTVISPVSSGGTITIVQDSDYLVATDSQIVLTIADVSGVINDLLDAADSLTIGAGRPGEGNEITGTIASTSYSTDVTTISVQFTRESTVSAVVSDDYSYQIARIVGSDKIVVVRGSLRLLEDTIDD